MSKIFHMKLNLPIHQENTENNDIEREENVILQNQELYPEKNTTQSSTGKHTSQETANKSKGLRYMKFVNSRWQYSQTTRWLGNGKENTI